MAVKIDDTCYIKKYGLDTFIEMNNNQIECGENTYAIPQVVTTGDGLYESQTDEGRLIYRGSNPNNYILLKENGIDTVYRIISYEPDGTIKVVRDNSIGNIPFDTETPRKNTSGGYYCNTSYDCNVWGNQTNTYYNDKTLSKLNQDFYFHYYPDNSSSNMSIKPNNNTGIVDQDSTLNTYLNITFYNTLDFKNNIETHSFNVGGVYYYNTFNDGYKGGDKGLLKEKGEEQVYTWNGKIAMMNITEFVETSLSNTCSSVFSNFYYNPNNVTQDPNNTSNYTPKHSNGNWPCALQNWNYKSTIHQWFLSASSYYNHGVWIVSSLGNFYISGTNATNIGARPAFYLKSDVILSGNGTESNPYKIANI